MKRKATRRILSIIMVLVMIVPMCVMSASAATIPYTYYEGNSVYGASIMGYTMYTGKTFVYTDARLTGYKITSSGSREYIDGTDEVTILGFNTYYNTVQVSYPTVYGYNKIRWVSANTFFPNGVNGATAFEATDYMTVYKYPSGGETYGCITASEDTCYKLGTYNYRTRVIYKTNRGVWKMAWVKNDEFKGRTKYR